MKSVLCAVLSYAVAICSLQGISPAFLFQDGAVLQQGKPVPVWGTSSPGETVTVVFQDQTKSSVADEEGRWSVLLEPLEPSHEPTEMLISGQESLLLSGILVGEVWLASGQSNMVWHVHQSYDADLEIAAVNWPLIREITVGRTVADAPRTTGNGIWQTAGPDTVAEFSAVAYSFARDLHQILQVPVGIINATWGGSAIESWIPPRALAENPAFSQIDQRWQAVLDAYPAAAARYQRALAEWESAHAAARAAGTPFSRNRPRPPIGPGHHNTPSGIYNGMVHPLIPYAFRGAIWYQGESNIDRHNEYHALFSSMITSWREAFKQDDFPFYWVQLASFHAGNPHGTHWAFLREAQTLTLELPATGQAVILDVSDARDIHPRNKQPVGRRLARLALNRTYERDFADSGPLFERAEVEEGQIRIWFTNTLGGLTFPGLAVRGFELAGEDRVFHPASATIAGDSAILVSGDVPSPQFARYAWRNAPEATLANRAGLPATPFRTDDFPY